MILMKKKSGLYGLSNYLKWSAISDQFYRIRYINHVNFLKFGHSQNAPEGALDGVYRDDTKWVCVWTNLNRTGQLPITEQIS